MDEAELNTLINDMLDSTKSSYQRTRAFEDFLKHPEHPEALSVVSTLLDDTNRSLRSDVVRGLVRKPKPEYFPLLAKALGDEDEYVKREALRGLTACTDSGIIESIRALAATASYSLKADAERTLRMIEENLSALNPVSETPAPEDLPEAEPTQNGPGGEDVDTSPVSAIDSPTTDSGEASGTPPLVSPAPEGNHSLPPPIPHHTPPPLPTGKARATTGAAKPPPTRPPQPSKRPPKTDIPRERSNCGAVACGCLVVAAVIGMILFALVFLVGARSAKPPTPIAPIRLQSSSSHMLPLQGE